MVPRVPGFPGRPPSFTFYSPCIYVSILFAHTYFYLLFLLFADSTVNQVPQSHLQVKDLKKVLAYHGPPELKGWGRAAHILLQYERSYSSFLVVPSWHQPLEFDRRSSRRKFSAVRTPKPSNRSSAFNAQSSASPCSSEPSPSTEQLASDSKRPTKVKRSSWLAAPSSASSSSYSKDPHVLNISDNSSSSSGPNNPSPIMSKHKAKNLLDNLGNLPAPGASKTPISDPFSMLGK